MKARMIMALCLLLGICACTKSSIESTYNTQEVNIDSYVEKYLSSSPDTRVVYNESVVRMVLTEGEGAELDKEGSATVYYAGYIFNNGTMNASTLFATNDSDVAATSNWTISDESVFAPVELSLKGDLVEGLKLGLRGARKGEDCLILFSGKYGFGRQVGTIPANAALAYRVQVKDVTN